MRLQLVAISSVLHCQLLPPRALVLRMDATPPPSPPEAPAEAPPPAMPDRRGLAVAGLVAGGAGVTVAAALGLASALGWDLSAVGDSDNRGVGTPLSREESAALLKAELRTAALRERRAAERGTPVPPRCQRAPTLHLSSERPRAPTHCATAPGSHSLASQAQELARPTHPLPAAAPDPSQLLTLASS